MFLMMWINLSTINFNFLITCLRELERRLIENVDEGIILKRVKISNTEPLHEKDFLKEDPE